MKVQLAALALSTLIATPAAAQSARYGFVRDEQGRELQTHFDLRRRFAVGAGWVGSSEQDVFASSSQLSMGGIYESYKASKGRRRKFRYLQAELRVDQLEVDATVLEYSSGRRSREPLLWITTFVGPPRRFDLNLDVAPGALFGRITLNEYGNRRTGLADIAQGHLDWGVFQGLGLEDYVALRVAAGIGLRFVPNGGDAALYLYPEAGLRSAWLIGQRGLSQFTFDGRIRVGKEVETGNLWKEGRAMVGFERVLLAVSDQPIALYVEPSVRYADFGARSAEAELRAEAGVRLSIFPPPPRRLDRCADPSRSGTTCTSLP